MLNEHIGCAALSERRKRCQIHKDNSLSGLLNSLPTQYEVFCELVVLIIV